MSKGREEYYGERLAKTLQAVRRGEAINKWNAKLLVFEIEWLRREVQRLEEDLAGELDATRYQTPHDCEQWLEDARICRRCSAAFRSSVDEGSLREISRLERELDMARAARNVALDKLLQIARIVSPDDFEEEDA